MGKKVILIFVIAVLSGLVGCHTVNNVKSTYRNKPPHIDGRLEEWGNEMAYDKTSKLHYAISHDDQNIYLALNVKDNLVQRKILMFGMTLWIDTTGSKKQLKGVRYPMPPEKRKEVRKTGGNNGDLPLRAQQAMPEAMRRVFRPALMDKMTLLGFNDIEEETVSIAENAGIDVRIQRQKMGGLAYEAKIPYSMLCSRRENPEESLSLGIITGHLELSERKSGMRSPGGINPGGGRYPGTGTRGGQMNRPRPGAANLEELQKSTKLWLKDIQFVGEEGNSN